MRCVRIEFERIRNDFVEYTLTIFILALSIQYPPCFAASRSRVSNLLRRWTPLPENLRSNHPEVGQIQNRMTGALDSGLPVQTIRGMGTVNSGCSKIPLVNIKAVCWRVMFILDGIILLARRGRYSNETQKRRESERWSRENHDPIP